MGHEVIIFKNKSQQQGEEELVIDQEEEDQLFVATCFAGNESSESQLIDSGCTNHKTNDKKLFKDLRLTNITKVKIGNGDYISVKGKGIFAIASCLGTRLIPDVLFILKIQQNLLSVGQLIKRSFKVAFEDNYCVIRYETNHDIFKVKMERKSFALNPLRRSTLLFQLKKILQKCGTKDLGIIITKDCSK